MFYETVPSSSQSTAIEVSLETDTSARGLLTKSATEATNAPAIFGYIQDVGPTKLSAKNSEYFTAPADTRKTKLNLS